MNNYYKYDVKVEGHSIGNYCLLPADEDKRTIVFDNFEFSKEGLIPQPWFGNINKKPDILILGNNPSYKCNGDINDITDNKNDYIRQILNKNLVIENREDDINSISWLLEGNPKKVYLCKWWQDFFGETGLELIKDKANKIGILNIYPYYSNSFKVIDDLNSPLCIDELKEIIKDAKIIVFLWKGSIEHYEKMVLKEPGYFSSDECKSFVYIGNAYIDEDGKEQSTHSNTHFFKHKIKEKEFEIQQYNKKDEIKSLKESINDI